MGRYVLVKKNERGEKLIECLSITKIDNNKHVVYTTKTEENAHGLVLVAKTRNQIDYTMINTRFSNSVKQIKHIRVHTSVLNPAVATVKINQKRINKKVNMEKFNLDMLKYEQMRQQYAVEVNHIL